jgi:hypothetical protein
VRERILKRKKKKKKNPNIKSFLFFLDFFEVNKKTKGKIHRRLKRMRLGLELGKRLVGMCVL